jgi:hypothetical protein
MVLWWNARRNDAEGAMKQLLMNSGRSAEVDRSAYRADDLAFAIILQ